MKKRVSRALNAKLIAPHGTSSWSIYIARIDESLQRPANCRAVVRLICPDLYPVDAMADHLSRRARTPGALINRISIPWRRRPATCRTLAGPLSHRDSMGVLSHWYEGRLPVAPRRDCCLTVLDEITTHLVKNWPDAASKRWTVGWRTHTECEDCSHESN